MMQAVAATKSLPPGVVNIFTESGNEGAPFMVGSPHVDIINYTGSTKVGRSIAVQAAGTLKTVTLELGGKTPLWAAIPLRPDPVISARVLIRLFVAQCLLRRVRRKRC
jgi:acyl-CoA reductase-like NAD-dependent aldehyde dehydrogenase